MVFYVVIRGPLGVGKTTVAARLAKRISAECISIDRILDEHGLWEAGRLSEFLQANEFGVPQARGFLEKGTPVIFGGNFYWKTQIKDLVGQLDYRRYIFTLKAPLRLCIERDRGRVTSHGSKGAKEVYAKATKFDYGIGVDATRSIECVLHEITSHISQDEAQSQW
jgi:adenylate kinase family enzyme